MRSGDWGGALAPSAGDTMHDLAACGMADQAQCGLGGDRLPPGTGVGVDRKTRAGGGRAAAAVRISVANTVAKFFSPWPKSCSNS